MDVREPPSTLPMEWARSLLWEEDDLNGEHASRRLKHDPVIGSGFQRKT